MLSDQPMPNGDDTAPNMQDLVIQDLKERLEVGIKRYGQGLKAFNGRDSQRDLYEEILDAACYLKQDMVKRDQIIQELKTKINRIEGLILATEDYQYIRVRELRAEVRGMKFALSLLT
jgi:hypothetical protein